MILNQEESSMSLLGFEKLSRERSNILHRKQLALLMPQLDRRNQEDMECKPMMN